MIEEIRSQIDRTPKNIRTSVHIIYPRARAPSPQTKPPRSSGLLALDRNSNCTLVGGHASSIIRYSSTCASTRILSSLPTGQFLNPAWLGRPTVRKRGHEKTPRHEVISFCVQSQTKMPSEITALTLVAAPLGAKVRQRRSHGHAVCKVHVVHCERFHERPRVVHVVPPFVSHHIEVPNSLDRV